MKIINIETDLPIEKVKQNFKKEADYYAEGENQFSFWSLADFNKKEIGIHSSIDEEKGKICSYVEDGIDHKNFIIPITYIFSASIKEKNGKTRIIGSMQMSPMFNILLVITLGVLVCGYIGIDNQRTNIALLFALIAIYFYFVKRSFRALGNRLNIYIDACCYVPQKKVKKNNPNKKKGKWSGKKY